MSLSNHLYPTPGSITFLPIARRISLYAHLSVNLFPSHEAYPFINPPFPRSRGRDVCSPIHLSPDHEGGMSVPQYTFPPITREGCPFLNTPFPRSRGRDVRSSIHLSPDHKGRMCVPQYTFPPITREGCPFLNTPFSRSRGVSPHQATSPLIKSSISLSTGLSTDRWRGVSVYQPTFPVITSSIGLTTHLSPAQELYNSINTHFLWSRGVSIC